MAKESEFFIHARETKKRLHITRTESIKGTAFSPCCMGPDDVDYEMNTGKHPEILEICGMSQEGLEHFALHYGKSYRYLNFFKCQLIRDFSPLEDLPKLERVDLYWNIRADRLWNMEKNVSLKSLRISDAKKMTLDLTLVNTSKTIEDIFVSGSIFNNYPMESINCFSGLPSLRYIGLNNIRLNDRNMSAIEALPNLERFDFDAGMLTTEEIAWIVAKYPHLSGKCLCAYNKEDAMLNDVRVCGFRKPGLDLPKDQARLEKYVAQFEALIEQYRNEIHNQS